MASLETNSDYFVASTAPVHWTDYLIGMACVTDSFAGSSSLCSSIRVNSVRRS